MFHWNLSDFHQKFKEEWRHIYNWLTHLLKQIAQFISSDSNKIDRLHLIRLIPYVIFVINIVIFTEQLQKPESSPISGDTISVINNIISCASLNNILSTAILLFFIVEVIVIYNFNMEILCLYRFHIAFIYVFKNYLA